MLFYVFNTLFFGIFSAEVLGIENNLWIIELDNNILSRIVWTTFNYF